MDIHTERLLLRPPTVSDVQPMFEIHQDPDVMRFVGKPGETGAIKVAFDLRSAP